MLVMQKTNWIGRMEAAVARARTTRDSEAKLRLYDLAGRYSVEAGRAAPFMLPHKGPATEGEREALRLPVRRLGAGGAAR
jgi:hypothetical protein